MTIRDSSGYRTFFWPVAVFFAAGCAKDPTGRVIIRTQLPANFNAQRITGFKIVVDSPTDAGSFNLTAGAAQTMTSFGKTFTTQVTDDDSDQQNEFVVTFGSSPFGGAGSTFDYYLTGNWPESRPFVLRCAVLFASGTPEAVEKTTLDDGTPIRFVQTANGVVTCNIGCLQTDSCTTGGGNDGGGGGGTPTAAPTGIATIPPSPANVRTPKISGSAVAGSTVRVYTNAACTTLAVEGSASNFADGGLTPPAVSANSTTTYYVTATALAQSASPCPSDGGSITYVEDELAPDAAVVLASSPVSPSPWRLPTLTGTADPNTTVRVYTSSTCDAGLVATGTAAVFAGSGISASVPVPVLHSLRAQATDLAGNAGPCGAPFTYDTRSAGGLIAAGGNFSCAVTDAGGAKCWGIGANFGQVGDGALTNRATPVNVSGATTGVAKIFAGRMHGCLIATNGTVRCWGYNTLGATGTSAGETDAGDETFQATPVTPALDAGALAIALGRGHTCLLTPEGAVKCWGLNTGAQCGDGTTASPRKNPVDVIGLDGGVVAIGSGPLANVSCAIMTDGALRCWGYNGQGQLGTGNTDIINTAVAVSLGETAVAAAGGVYHTCAALTNGTVKCWGGSNPTPTQVLAQQGNGFPLTDVISVVAGDLHTCALTQGGAVKCWGDNRSGQLGDGTTRDKTTAVDVYGLDAGVVAISAGEYHTCALLSSGGIKCWGDFMYGALGDGRLNYSVWSDGIPSTAPAAAPTTVVASGGTGVVVGDNHTCAIIDGGVRCWGHGEFGQLGNGGTIVSPGPVSVVGLSERAGKLSRGAYHTCTLTVDGGIFCWGQNDAGQMGTYVNEANDALTAVQVPIGRDDPDASLYGADYRTCAIADNRVYCWGFGPNGSFGDPGNQGPHWTPMVVLDPPVGAILTSVSLSERTSCATTNTELFCWGDNTYGQIGTGATVTEVVSPVATVDGDAGAIIGAAGEARICAVVDGGWIRCAGNGIGSTLTDIDAGPLGITAMASGGDHTCAIDGDGGVVCWGYGNSRGALGNNSTEESPMDPVNAIGLSSGVTQIAAVGATTCAIAAGGALYCWGDNEHAIVGDGTVVSRGAPTLVTGLSSGVAAVAMSKTHACALKTTGAIVCWGRDFWGEVSGTGPILPHDVVGFGP